MKPIKVDVTRNCITAGLRSFATKCPVALAVMAATKSDICLIFYNCITTRHGAFKTPIKVQKFIHNFDQGRPVKPFTFTLTSRNLCKGA